MKSVRLIEIFSALSVKKFFLSTLIVQKSDHDFLNFFQHSDFLANSCYLKSPTTNSNQKNDY
ncbi:hypothetical protein [Helicobacter pylori]|uniref:hypothetical protein n=1 Tax=Helicobacter pylori TaxID=210 RepID=UPI00130E1D26|nr:hypothetical protein [Helicobacter pylori]